MPPMKLKTLAKNSVLVSPLVMIIKNLAQEKERVQEKINHHRIMMINIKISNYHQLGLKGSRRMTMTPN